MQTTIPRKKYLSEIQKYIGTPVIKVITGQRRTGKSSFLKSLLHTYFPKEKYAIYSINKELLEFDHIKTYEDLNRDFLAWKKKKGHPKSFVIAIDEIQVISGWEKYINSVFAEYSNAVDIFITGSNSQMLASELSTFIAGRYIEFPIFPLSFSEYPLFSGEKDQKKNFQTYLQFGGLPGVFEMNNDKLIRTEYLKSVYTTIFVKDILHYHQIKNVVLFEKLYTYIFKNIGNLFSAKKIHEYLQSQKIQLSVDTILQYLHFGTATYLLHEVPRFDIVGKKIFQVSQKYYAGDIGLRNALTGFNAKEDIGNILENIVFLELRSRGYEVFVGVMGKYEIDFIAKKNNETLYIQVCYLLADEKVSEREFGNLMKISDNWPKMVLSMDELPLSNHEGITHKNIVEWLMET